MAWKQLETVRHQFDAGNGGARKEALSAALPSTEPQNGSCMFLIRNAGTDAAYLIVADDVGNVETTALVIPASGSLESPEYAWPGEIPQLNGLLDADCYVTALIRGTP